MRRHLFYFLSLAMLMSACKDSSHNDDVTGDDGDMNVTFDVDWSNMPTKPTGLTLCFYPLGGVGNDTILRYDVVDKVSVTLPEQDYAVICFNQSEDAFPDYKFDLSSYESASVSGIETSSLQPGTLAVASMGSVNKSTTTRGLSVAGVLKPTNVVKSMTLQVSVTGISERVVVNGTLSNMSKGVTMFDRKPLPEPHDQPLPPEVWSVDNTDGDEPIICANFGTFGPFMGDDSRAMTRAAADDNDLRNMLHVEVKSEETGEIIYEEEIDVTEEVVEQYLAAVEAEEQQGISGAFFPKGYDANNVAAWYAYESVEDQSGKRKVLAVYLFNDGSFITTKHKFGTDSIESREIENIGRYSMTKGDFSNGEAVIQMDSAGGSVTIVSNVLTVNVNGQEIEEKFRRQWGSVPDATSLSGEEEQGESADAFFPYGFEEYKVAAWYAYESLEEKSGKHKVIAVYLFENNIFVTTKRTVENGRETREIEAAGAYFVTSGDLNNGQLSIYAENIEENSDSTNTGEISVENPNMSATIQNGVMTVYEGKEAMEEQYTRQTGAVPEPQLPTNYESELVAEAFFPEGYESKTVAAWYGWSQYDAKSQKTKVLAVFLFDDNTFVTTKRKYENGVETREIEASGRYEMEGNYSNGQASIYAAAGLDTMLMSVTIVNDVMTVYENGQAMEETFTRQYGDVPSAMSVTNGESDMSSYAFFPISYEKLSVAAWYAYSDADSAQVKILAVYLFDNGTFVSTKRQYEDGVETREIELSGSYTLLEGDYENGDADIRVVMGFDTLYMSGTIENGVLKIYQGSTLMMEPCTKQSGSVPSGEFETAEIIQPEIEDEFEMQAVDLGLSVLWANCNVGATSEESYGTYFAWGETSGYNSETKDGKTNFSWETYKFGTQDSLTKYCDNERYGIVDGLSQLDSLDDAASVNLSYSWRTPTHEEWEELVNNTSSEWTTLNGVEGRKFTASNGNYIFLPAAGCRGDSSLSNAGSRGYYWSSSLYERDPSSAWDLYFDSDDVSSDRNDYYRDYGYSVRAVYPKIIDDDLNVH